MTESIRQWGISQKTVLLSSASATTAASPGTSLLLALSLAPLLPSSATRAVALGTFKPSALP